MNVLCFALENVTEDPPPENKMQVWQFSIFYRQNSFNHPFFSRNVLRVVPLSL